MVQEEEYRFDEPTKEKKSVAASIGSFIWNSSTKEFCGRDGASWGKVSLFYAVFYAVLGSFFVGMLAVFVAIMPKDRPTYYGESSTMNARGINPGLGFRPQKDVEDSLIHFNPRVLESDEKHGYKTYVNNLNNFLKSKYSPVPADELSNVIKCTDDEEYTASLNEGKSCEFDYKKIFATTNCTEENKYGYETNTPCVLIKLNKIISWLPKNKSISIKCEGETSVDKDNLFKVTYHSENHLNDNTEGHINSKYFPFFAQKSYRAPFIWAQFEITPNALINIECKAYAANIDNKDRMNRRGQTKFSLFVVNSKN